ncbi:MAG: hypothetical protein VB017_07785 [Endomicrobiaceae bacterium]|nr:hypothetical protein [Endomicrobiaceae bacterium]
MAQFHQLFDKSEIEYITPFLKLWMSFNNWYKQDLTNVKFDAEAIARYKANGKIKNEFLRFFSLNSEAGIDFQNALYDLILNLKTYDLKKEKRDGTSESVNYKIKDDQGVEFDLILENANRRGGKEPIFISTDKKRFQILEENKEKFFEQTLEIIYQIRCNLVHGSFDIENQYFIKLVESSYKILYPIMDKILQNIQR